MTIQNINIGNVVNDGLGDDLRTAFEKVNANFADLSTQLTITVGSAQTSGISLYKNKVGSQLIFKNLVAGTKMTLDDTGSAVIFNNTSPDAFTRFETNSGNIVAGVGNASAITLSGTPAPGNVTGRSDIEVTTSGSYVYFKTIVPVTDILTVYDFGTISGDFTNAMQLALSAANIDFGTIDFPGRIDIDCGSIV
jgi:hypothetical protein